MAGASLAFLWIIRKSPRLINSLISLKLVELTFTRIKPLLLMIRLGPITDQSMTTKLLPGRLGNSLTVTGLINDSLTPTLTSF